MTATITSPSSTKILIDASSGHEITDQFIEHLSEQYTGITHCTIMGCDKVTATALKTLVDSQVKTLKELRIRDLDSDQHWAFTRLLTADRDKLTSLQVFSDYRPILF